jgi:hypothetical protein
MTLAPGQHPDGTAPHRRGPHQAQHRPEPVRSCQVNEDVRLSQSLAKVAEQSTRDLEIGGSNPATAGINNENK